MNEIAIFVLCFGLIAGLTVLFFAFRMMRMDKEMEAKGATTNASETPVASEAEPPPAPPVSTAPEPNPAFAEVAKLVRTPDGLLALQADGNFYLRREDIADPKLMAALNELERFLKKEEALPPVARPSVTASPEPPAPSKPVEDLNGKSVVYMSAREAAQVPLTAPSMDILKQYRYLREREKQPEIKIKTVLEEIDELVQAKIADTPLAQRGLKVAADVTGAALFWIDGRSYSAVDEVPDPEARALVKAAIQEWERKK
ncbi:MAG: hypothetical protein HYZ49_00835 [Chloroflexi bacterium]|nr:hypothetical protein [Chloroflexota bacterium]